MGLRSLTPSAAPARGAISVRRFQGVRPSAIAPPPCPSTPIEPRPRLGDRVFVAPSAELAGDVEVGDDCSFWFHTAARGDVNSIRIGARTNVQDGAVLHVTHERFPLAIGDDVVIGHGAILHGCTLESGCLIGIGARVLDGAVVESGAQVGAGAVVPPGMRVPAGMLVLGIPARVSADAFRRRARRDRRDRAALRAAQGRRTRVEARGPGDERAAALRPRRERATSCRPTRPSGRRSRRRRAGSSRATATARSAPRSSRRPSSSPAASASRPTSSARRCTRSSTRASATSRSGRRAPPRSCRAYVEHGMHRLPPPVKLFYIGPQFRYERPQKGRYRQFHQIGAELLGGKGAEADAEVMLMLVRLPGRARLLGPEGAAQHGRRRRLARGVPRDARRVPPRPRDQRSREDSRRRLDTNPLRVLDSKSPEEQAILATPRASPTR